MLALFGTYGSGWRGEVGEVVIGEPESCSECAALVVGDRALIGSRPILLRVIF